MKNWDLKRLTALILTLLLTVGITPPITADNANNLSNNLISKENFLERVKESEEYNNFKEDLLDNQSELMETVESIKDDDGNLLGYMIHYETKYNEEDNYTLYSGSAQAKISFNSVLTFYYDMQQDEFGSFILDYSQLAKTHSAYLRDLQSDYVKEIDMSNREDLMEEVANAKSKAKTEMEMTDKNNEYSLQNLPMCWHCTRYETVGGHRHQTCEDVADILCGETLGTIPIVGSLICKGTTILSCYVPKNKRCVAGRWLQCPER